MIKFNIQKVKYLILGIIIGATISTSTIALADNQIKLFINGKQISTDDSPQMINNRVFVPVRVVSENLNCNVQWDQTTSSVIITSDKLESPHVSSQNITTIKEVNTITTSNQISLVNYKNMSAFKLNEEYFVAVSDLRDKYNVNCKWNPDNPIMKLFNNEFSIEVNTGNTNEVILYLTRFYVKYNLIEKFKEE